MMRGLLTFNLEPVLLYDKIKYTQKTKFNFNLENCIIQLCKGWLVFLCVLNFKFRSRTVSSFKVGHNYWWSPLEKTTFKNFPKSYFVQKKIDIWKVDSSQLMKILNKKSGRLMVRKETVLSSQLCTMVVFLCFRVRYEYLIFKNAIWPATDCNLQRNWKASYEQIFMIIFFSNTISKMISYQFVKVLY